MATSKNMIAKTIAAQCDRKGLNLIATGDALHSKWLNELEESLVEIDDSGIYELKDKSARTNFITTTEVEDNERIHHLIIIPSLDVAWQIRDEFVSNNIDADGRPKLRMNASEIMDVAHSYKCLMGPAHIFTPWTGMYKSYDSIGDCYTQKADFVELGLSADTYMAQLIGELKDYAFLTNSDSHSPWPHRIGREFNKIEVESLSYDGIVSALKDNTVLENYGINPLIGKYHETGCIKCKRIYDIHEAMENQMKCSCGGRIKKGVKSRVEELATCDKAPIKRPHYQYIVPLAELLSTIYSKGITTKFVQSRYDNLLNLFGNEINVLLNVSIDKISEVDSSLAKIISLYRKNDLDVVAGRGGEYGHIQYNNL